MRASFRLTLACLPSLLASASLFAQDNLTINVNNDSTNNLLVTVYDRNVQPRLKILSQVINGNASVAVSITADASGQGHISWTATTRDRDMRQCGHSDKAHLNDGDTVNVHADSDCSS